MKSGGSGKPAEGNDETRMFPTRCCLRFLFGRIERIPNVRPFTQARDTAGIRQKASYPRCLANWKDSERGSKWNVKLRHPILASSSSLYVGSRNAASSFPGSRVGESNRESNRTRRVSRILLSRVLAVEKKEGSKKREGGKTNFSARVRK